MTTALRPQSDLQQWRPRSQPGPEHQERPRSKRHSPNRVKAKPASPAVINSIIDSLDGSISPAEGSTEDTASIGSHSTRERPYSAGGTVRSVSSRTRSDSYSYSIPEEPRGRTAHHEGPMIDAAVSPIIRTSRPPSGLSNYNAPRTPSFTGSSEHASRRTASTRSQQSSRSSNTKEKSAAARNKLSAESWVKQNSMSRESVETRETKKSSRKSLRRKNSEDTLRPPKTRIELVPPATEPPFISRAEQIIAKVSTPPPSASKGRLYLTDSGSTEDQGLPESPEPIEEALDREAFPNTPSPSAYEEAEEQRISRRVSPQKNAIADSIPMRTSSLRLHSSSPGPGKRKEKKSRRTPSNTRKPESKSDSVMESSAKSIPESSWADLGEEDETVKRIRELQERRRSRLMDFNSSPTQELATIQPGVELHLANNDSPSARKGQVSAEPSKREARPDPPRNLQPRPTKSWA